MTSQAQWAIAPESASQPPAKGSDAVWIRPEPRASSRVARAVQTRWLREYVHRQVVGGACAGLLGLSLLLNGCEDDNRIGIPPADVVSPTPAEAATPSATPEALGLGSSPYDAASVQMTGRVIVRSGPSAAAERIGLIAKDSRLKPLAWRPGPGCKEGWVRVGAGEWVCGRNVLPSKDPPLAIEQPPLEPGNLIPAIYGDVRSSSAGVFASVGDIKKGKISRKLTGHTVVRKVEEVDLEGTLYWKIASGEYILAADLKPYNPSGFHGVYLEQGIALPLVFVMPDPTYKKPGITSPSIVSLAAGRGIARVYERVANGSGKGTSYKYRIGEEEWVSGPLLRYAIEREPPKDILPDEPWVDINLSQQVLVAYRGVNPLYVTLISSGKLDPTPRGLFRIYLKFSETSMGSEMGDDRPYLIENVPWTQFFQAGIALHCAFWHNGFGHPRSRGCVNLAPIDARTIFQFAQPVPSPGWTSLHGSVHRPGTLVRVWADEEEELYYYGLARDVAKARGVRVKGAPSLKEQMEKTKEEQSKKFSTAGPAVPAKSGESSKSTDEKRSLEGASKGVEGGHTGASKDPQKSGNEKKKANTAGR